METCKSVQRGVAAGTAGTLALTLAENAEMKLSGREPSPVPGQVAAKLLGRDPDADPAVTKRLSPLVHWTHGITLGAVRGLLDAAGLSPRAATLAFYPLVWGGDALLYRALGIAPAPWRWSRGELLTDLFGKGVLAFATSSAYLLLDD